MSTLVRTSLEGPLARITLDRPPLNILTTEMLEDLAQALLHADAAPSVHVIRLDASGKAFSAGVDVADHEGERVTSMMAALRALFSALAQVRVPTIAVVQGACLGGGLEIALGTDLCIASERASFGQPEVRLGLFAPPASVLLPRIVGERRALDLLLTGETIPAREALSLGIVNRVFPEVTFAGEADAWIARLTSLSGPALRLAKKAVVAARGLAADEAHREVERIYLEELMRTEDAQEGLRSFLEKRAPVWRHR